MAGRNGESERCMCCGGPLANDTSGRRCEDCWASAQGSGEPSARRGALRCSVALRRGVRLLSLVGSAAIREMK